jgi:hypothetical protein
MSEVVFTWVFYQEPPCRRLRKLTRVAGPLVLGEHVAILAAPYMTVSGTATSPDGVLIAVPVLGGQTVGAFARGRLRAW